MSVQHSVNGAAVKADKIIHHGQKVFDNVSALTDWMSSIPEILFSQSDSKNLHLFLHQQFNCQKSDSILK